MAGRHIDVVTMPPYGRRMVVVVAGVVVMVVRAPLGGIVPITVVPVPMIVRIVVSVVMAIMAVIPVSTPLGRCGIGAEKSNPSREQCRTQPKNAFPNHDVIS